MQTNTISTVRNIDSECGIFNVLAVFLRTRPRKTLIEEEAGTPIETGSIPASSDTVESERRQKKQC